MRSSGATLAPSTMSLIRNMFLDPKQRAVAIGVWISSYSAGAVIGPAMTSALVALGMAVLVMVSLRRVRSASDGAARSDGATDVAVTDTA